MRIVTLSILLGGAGLAAAQAPAPVPAGPPPRPPVSRMPYAPLAAADADRKAAAGDEVSRTLAQIERQANVVQQHPETSSAEAQAAARSIHSLAPQLTLVAPPGVQPQMLVVFVDAMAESARRMDTAPDTRAAALQVIVEIHRYRGQP